MTKGIFFAAVSAAVFSTGAAAQQPMGPYAGVLAGTSAISRDLVVGGEDVSYKQDKFTWGALLGWQFHPNLAVELGHLSPARLSESVEFGADTYDARMKATGWAASALLSYPFAQRWSVHGRLGALRAIEKYSVSLDGTRVGSEKRRSTDLLYGVGVGVMISEAARLRLDYQRAEFDAGDVGAISVGANWFLPFSR